MGGVMATSIMVEPQILYSLSKNIGPMPAKRHKKFCTKQITSNPSNGILRSYKALPFLRSENNSPHIRR